MELYQLAKIAEANNEWLDAANLWSMANRKDDAEACMLIHNSTLLGDTYRNRIANEIGAEPDKAENPHKWVKWYDGMTKIYNEVFTK